MTNATLGRSAFSGDLGEPGPEFTPREDVYGDGAPVQSPSPLSLAANPASPAPTRLSQGLIGRLIKFVGWEQGWDGESAERVEARTAIRAMEIAEAMLPVAEEPFVAPALSGSLLLQWGLADGASVDFYVDGEAAFPGCAAVDRGGIVSEVRLAGPESLRSLLESAATAPGA